MAGCIANADEEQLVFGFGFCQGFFAPGVPIDGVVCMLKQVGAALADEFVGVPVIAFLAGSFTSENEEGKKEKNGLMNGHWLSFTGNCF
jgi:hypothetical protein